MKNQTKFYSLVATDLEQLRCLLGGSCLISLALQKVNNEISYKVIEVRAICSMEKLESPPLGVG